MTTALVLAPLRDPHAAREGRDRLEVLTALIGGPAFDPLFRPDVIRIPHGHPVYRWECQVGGCERPAGNTRDLCPVHARLWKAARETGAGRAEFYRTATPLPAVQLVAERRCLICPERPAISAEVQLCFRHVHRWRAHRRRHRDGADFQRWLGGEVVYDGYGRCRTAACPELANSALGLCLRHETRYRRQNRPGRAMLPPNWFHVYEQRGLSVPVRYGDEAAFRHWCAQTDPIGRPGQISLLGLRPLLAAEVKWGLAAHTQGPARRLGDRLGAAAGQPMPPPRPGVAGRAGPRWVHAVRPAGRHRDTQGTAAGVLHPGRHPRGRVHRDRPLRGAVHRPHQPPRPDRDLPAVAA